MYVSPTPGMKIHQHDVSYSQKNGHPYHLMDLGYEVGEWVRGWVWGGMGCLDGKYWNSTCIHVWCSVGMVEC